MRNKNKGSKEGQLLLVKDIKKIFMEGRLGDSVH